MIIDMDYISVKAASEKWTYRNDGYKNYVKKTALRVLKNLVGHLTDEQIEKIKEFTSDVLAGFQGSDWGQA